MQKMVEQMISANLRPSLWVTGHIAKQATNAPNVCRLTASELLRVACFAP